RERQIVANPGPVLCCGWWSGRICWKPKLLVAYPRARGEASTGIIRVGVIDGTEAGAIIHPRDMDATLAIHMDGRITPGGCTSRVVNACHSPSPAAIRARLDSQPGGGAVSHRIDRAPVRAQRQPRQL